MEFLESNNYIPGSLHNLVDDKNLNYDQHIVPKFIETTEDELMFLHAWLNPATLERMKVAYE